MSEAAKLILTGASRESLLIEIAKIKAWDSGHDYPIIIEADSGKQFSDSIENVESAINGDLAGYLEKNFGNKRNILKSGGNDDLFFVTNPDLFNEENLFRKIRRRQTNITPPKKRRRKH